MLQGKVKSPRATDKFLLRVLVEIGLHKLKGDHITYLLSKELTTPDVFDEVCCTSGARHTIHIFFLVACFILTKKGLTLFHK